MQVHANDGRLQAAVDFHGHLCPGLLIGYRAALLALDRLEERRSEDEELVAIVENDSCSADAVQFLTGCTFGKGNFIFRDWGKQVFTLARRPHGRGVRLAFKGDALKPKAPDGSTDREAFQQVLMEAADRDLFDVTEGTFDLPKKARIFNTIPCDGCGEGTMAPRLTNLNGRNLCRGCLLAQDPAVVMNQTADFMFEVGMLKKTPRTGYQFLGNGFETVAAHSFRAAIIAFVLGRYTPGVDAPKAASMTLFHDLAEARTGDHNYVNKQYVDVDEKRAERDATANAPCGRELLALLDEFRAGQTMEAQLAHDADQLDMIIELKEKKDLGNSYAAAWLFYAEKRLKTEAGAALFQAVMETDWSHWWFDRKEHLWVRK